MILILHAHYSLNIYRIIFMNVSCRAIGTTYRITEGNSMTDVHGRERTLFLFECPCC